MPLSESMIGAPIYTEDGEQLGTLKETRGRFFKVNAQMQPDYWLPEECLGSTSGSELRLRIGKDRLGDYKTDEPGDYVETQEVQGTSRAAERSTTERTEGVQLREEQLQARKAEEQAGEVRIGKDVVTEHKEMDVPVRHEEVVVERRPAEGQPVTGNIGEGEEVRVPVTRERVEVDKQPVVREEVSVGKREVTETERVEADVRREEARVEREGDVRVEGEPRPPSR